MKKIVIDQQEFSYDIGCKVLKLKYKECPFKEIEDIWDDIQPITFPEIAKDIVNIESRRVAIQHLGIENFYKQTQPTLINSSTLEKTTTWVNREGVMETISYKDTYYLYKVDGRQFSKGTTRSADDVYLVKCKDTSTDREYFIWVDVQSVYHTNHFGDSVSLVDEKVNAIQAVAWTIQTNVPEKNIEKIVRQGDCILIKTKGDVQFLKRNRHLTEKEYINLLSLES
jgi:hypothetical protein